MIKKAVDFVLFGSIFISFCTVALCIETNLLLKIKLNHFSFYAFVFGATLAQYNLHYLIKKSPNPNSARSHWSLTNMATHKRLIFAGSVLCLFSLFYFNIYHFVFVSTMGLIAFFYSYPALPFRKKKRLKDFGFLKICILALMWTLVTVWFPVDQSQIESTIFSLIFVRRFIFIFALCLLFDIRDVKTDFFERRKTIPVVLGIDKSYKICYLLLIVMVIISAFQLYNSGSFAHFNAMLLSALATIFMIQISKVQPGDYIYLAGIDGMLLLQAVLVVIGSI